MRSINSPEYSRNYGFWNEAEQQALMSAHVAIAGVGGDGAQLGLKLAMNGVQTFDIADPEVFEPENANRVPSATTSTYGLNKAEVFKQKVLDINPDADVRVFSDGITEENTEEFMSRATLVFDESELTHLELGTAISREARRRNIPDVLVMNVGFAAQVTSFHPQSKMSFEKLMGIPEGMPLDEVRDLVVDFSRCLPYIPKYADLGTFAAVKDNAPLPSIAQGVDIASAIGASQAFKHITKGLGNHRGEPVWAPRFVYMDAYDFTSGVTRHPRFSHYRTLGKVVVRELLGINPKTSYKEEERNSRLAKNTQTTPEA